MNPIKENLRDLRISSIAMLCLVCIFFGACSTDESVIPAASDLDKKSYEGLEDVFSNTDTIETKGKYMLLVFGANGCGYCENLKNDIKHNEVLRTYLKDNFSAYYINISYNKAHTFIIGEDKETKNYIIPTHKITEMYRIGPTPTLVLSAKDGRTITIYPSYLPPKQFMALLKFINEGLWEKANGNENKLRELLQSYLQNEV